uniref:SpoU_methylase domain-containing protein n=1 Tax=Thelazia callipaeda TaxID=103827 RepID=A0A0N5D6Q1_THECL
MDGESSETSCTHNTMKDFMDYSARKHFELCLAEEKDFLIGKSHYRLAVLYPDFNQFEYDANLLSDVVYVSNKITEFQFYLKWDRPFEAAPVLERIIKTNATDEMWSLILQTFLKASSFESCTEKTLFTELSNDAFESVITILTKRFDNDDLLKTRLLLFCSRYADGKKFHKLLNRAVTFMTERANNDKELVNGIGKYHVYLAVIVAPVLMKLDFTNIAVSRALNIIITVLHVAVAWPKYHETWTNLLRTVSAVYVAEAQNFSQESFKIAAALFDKCVSLYDFGTPVNLSLNMSGCSSLSTIVDKAYSLKSEACKIAFLFFMWFAYSKWRANVDKGEVLAWIPEDNWVMDVDKLLSSSSDGTSSSKKARIKERREEFSIAATEYLMSSRPELCEVYELCCTALSAFVASPSSVIAEHLYFVPYNSDIKLLIIESLLFKSKVNELVVYAGDQFENNDDSLKELIHFQVACGQCIGRNWPDACENVISMLSIATGNDESIVSSIIFYYLLLNVFTYKKKNKPIILTNGLNTIPIQADPRCAEIEHTPEPSATEVSVPQPSFVIVHRKRLRNIVFDLAYHILFRLELSSMQFYKWCFKVYTSTAMDHENDRLLGALLILSQIDFSGKGYKCFNRIMRHVEAKGSLKSAGLVKYITNVAILEELSRIHNYCSEYVSIEIAVPQVQRRIGQSTRHSVRGTKDGQKQSIEEQIKKCERSPYATVSDYFTENKDELLKMLGASF